MPYRDHQYYEVHGEGYPLVLLHGHTLDRRMWDDQVLALSSNYRVITPDLGGHGLSKQPSDGSSHAQDLVRLLDHIGVARAAVCGLSMGGAVAVSFAVHYPDHCAALIPVDATLFGYRHTEWTGSRHYVKMARQEGFESALQAWMADPLFAPAMASACAKRVRSIMRSFPRETWLDPGPPPAPPGPRECDRLGEIAAPTLVIVGEHDLPDFLRVAQLIGSHVPGARMQVIRGSGHLAPMEQPAEFNLILSQFLSDLALV